MSRKLTLIKRSHPICASCNVMQAQLEGEGIPHEIIDISAQPDAIEKLDITGVPVLIIEDDNGEHIRLTGLQPIERVAELMKEDAE
jgi:glutaredoxin